MSFLAISILSINLFLMLFDLRLLSSKKLKNHFFKLPVFLQKLESVLTIQAIFHLFCQEKPMFSKNRDVIGGYRDARTRTL